jgi:hypothetical protein
MADAMSNPIHTKKIIQALASIDRYPCSKGCLHLETPVANEDEMLSHLRQPLDVVDYSLVVAASSKNVTDVPKGKSCVRGHFSLRNIQEHQLCFQLAQVGFLFFAYRFGGIIDVNSLWIAYDSMLFFKYLSQEFDKRYDEHSAHHLNKWKAFQKNKNTLISIDPLDRPADQSWINFHFSRYCSLVETVKSYASFILSLFCCPVIKITDAFRHAKIIYQFI